MEILAPNSESLLIGMGKRAPLYVVDAAIVLHGALPFGPVRIGSRSQVGGANILVGKLAPQGRAIEWGVVSDNPSAVGQLGGNLLGVFPRKVGGAEGLERLVGVAVSFSGLCPNLSAGQEVLMVDLGDRPLEIVLVHNCGGVPRLNLEDGHLDQFGPLFVGFQV